MKSMVRRGEAALIQRSQRGFTLIEIMVVVVILGILAALIVPKVLNRPEQAKITVAKADINAISTALSFYKLDNGRYPTTDQGLAALVHKPTTGPDTPRWNPDGYLPRVPQDPWGNPYVYLSPGNHGPYDLYSLGADGQSGSQTSDTIIGNWEEHEK